MQLEIERLLSNQTTHKHLCRKRQASDILVNNRSLECRVTERRIVVASFITGQHKTIGCSSQHGFDIALRGTQFGNQQILHHYDANISIALSKREQVM